VSKHPITAARHPRALDRVSVLLMLSAFPVVVVSVIAREGWQSYVMLGFMVAWALVSRRALPRFPLTVATSGKLLSRRWREAARHPRRGRRA